jgi:hypothetical protein
MRLVRIAIAFCVLFGSSLHAQSARTFVASTGNDVNPCSLASPCRSFQAAINATASGGEVVALDSAGFGVMSIYSAVTVEAPSGIYAGVTLSATSTAGARVLMANETDVAVLRGLFFTGPGTPDTEGIDFLGPGLLHVDSCVISGFSSGIDFSPPTSPSGQATIENTTVRNCAVAIRVSNLGNVMVDHCSLENCSSGGLFVLHGGAAVVIRNSVIDGNGNGIAMMLPFSASDATIDVENCLIAHSTAAGIDAEGGQYTGFDGKAIIRVSNSMIVFNATGLSAGTLGEIDSFGNNRLSDNGTPGAFSSTIALQ